MWLVNFSTMATGNLSFGLFVIPMGGTLSMNRSMFGWAVTTRSLAAGLSGTSLVVFLIAMAPRS